MRCTRHRTGCTRCRRRGDVCTYSFSQRRGRGRKSSNPMAPIRADQLSSLDMDLDLTLPELERELSSASDSSVSPTPRSPRQTDASWQARTSPSRSSSSWTTGSILEDPNFWDAWATYGGSDQPYSPAAKLETMPAKNFSGDISLPEALVHDPMPCEMEQLMTPAPMAQMTASSTSTSRTDTLEDMIVSLTTTIEGLRQTVEVLSSQKAHR